LWKISALEILQLPYCRGAKPILAMAGGSHVKLLSETNFMFVLVLNEQTNFTFLSLRAKK
jgi:hypothetical protein